MIYPIFYKMTLCIWNTALYFLTCVNALNYRYYPRYHLAPPKGWMNDPNGFCIYKNKYHLFYQHNPLSSFDSGIPHWGHAISKDLFHWENLGIALYPDKWYDISGTYSGSAIIENDTMYLFYTGNVYIDGNEEDYRQRQAIASSTDGFNFKKYNDNPVINGSNLQPDIRDPKVWIHNGNYYMVLGNSFNNNTDGRVLLYASKDKITWEQVSVLAESRGELGYMWECPDFFELDGRYVLLFSPQGIEPEGDKYRNLYQVGYFVGEFDYTTHEFNILTPFVELDHGHDFYATQTILNNKGERIMVAWLDMWKTYYPEREDGFTGQMTIPRILSLTANGSIIQKPVREVANARGELIHTGKTEANTEIYLSDNTGQITVVASAAKDFNIYIESQNASKTVCLSFNTKQGIIALDRGGNDGVRRTSWRPTSPLLKWNIFLDTSSIELFCGDGEVTFSSRFFPDGKVHVRLGENSHADLLEVYNMKRTLYTN